MSKLALLGGEPVRDKGWPSWPVYTETEQSLLLDVLASRCWGDPDGPMERAFTEAFADYNKVACCLTTNTGTSSLLIALEALGIGAGDEVIVPGLTWTATATVVVEVNAVPVLVDVEPDTYCLDLDQLEAAITPRTRAVIPVHLYGCMADMDQLLEIAKRHGLAVIEDASHVHGAHWRGIAAGALGDIGAFSMQQSKVMTCGQGGAVITNNPRLAERLDALRTNGRRRVGEGYVVDGDPIGSNYRLSEFQAALLLAQLERLDEQNRRREIAARHLDERLSQIPGIQTMLRREQVTRQTYYYYVVRYDASYFAERPVGVIRRALSAELNYPVGEPYRPLNRNLLFRPRTKKRFHLNADHWNSLDPQQFELPVAARAYEQEAILFHHNLLLASPDGLDDVVRAFEKIHDHAVDLPLTDEARSEVGQEG